MKKHLIIAIFMILVLSRGNICVAGQIHEAAFNNSTQEVEALINEGADVNACSIDGETPLHYAVFPCAERDDCPCSKEVTDLLIKNGADLYVKDNKKMTPLQYAPEGGKARKILEKAEKRE